MVLAYNNNALLKIHVNVPFELTSISLPIYW